MLDWSIEQNDFPVVIRIPRGKVVHANEPVEKNYSDLNKYHVVQEGEKVAVLALGDFFQIGEKVVEHMKNLSGLQPTLINPRYASGLDEDLLNTLQQNHSVVVTLEDSILDGGFGQKIAGFYGRTNMKVLNYGLKKEFLDGYDATTVLEEYGITCENIVDNILNALNRK
jgi:1-deoxy-D-xylulose-5-phosphate synthase